MNQKDFIDWFLSDEPKAQSTQWQFSEGEVSVYKEASHFALKVDAWDHDKGRKIRGEWLPHQKEQRISDEAMTDFHAAAYQIEPTLVQECNDERRHQFVKSLMELPDFHEMRETTVLNEFASEIAAMQFAKEFSDLLCKDEERGKNPKKNQELRAESDLSGAVGKAVKKASKEIDDCMDIIRGLGGDGAEPSSMDPKKVAELFKKVKSNPHLQAICEKAGRYRRLARSRQRQKVHHGFDEITGIVPGSKIEDLTTSELAILSHPQMKYDVLRRLLDGQAMCIERKGVENMGKGPIIVCVDESGSMAGEPVQNAKAFALAMAWIAKRQKRYCCLISYAGDTNGVILELPPNNWNDQQLIDWLCHFYSGGTTMDVPLQELPKWFDNETIKCPKGKTDLIIITDAIVSVPLAMETKFNEWKKKEKVRCFSLVLATSAGDLKRVSDEIHLVKNMGVDEKAIEKCLSI